MRGVPGEHPNRQKIYLFCNTRVSILTLNQTKEEMEAEKK